MVQETIVGLDVHADSITAAILPPTSDTPEVVKLSGDLMQVRRLFRRLTEAGPVRSCYEASGAGFVLQRLLTYDGFPSEVIAPSLIPRKPGEHRKTDRLDAIMLARLYRSGHLTTVHVPDKDHEALRRLLRLRESYHRYCTATMQRISGVLRNHGYVFKEGKTAVKYKELSSKESGESSEKIRARVMQAREVQVHRFKGRKGMYANADMQSKEIREYCKLDAAGEELLKMAITKLGLSARAYDRILKVGRTIADMAESEDIRPGHISEAIQYRSLDRDLIV